MSGRARAATAPRTVSRTSSSVNPLGWIVRVGNRVGVSAINVFHSRTPDEPVAVAKGVYTIRRSEEAS